MLRAFGRLWRKALWSIDPREPVGPATSNVSSESLSVKTTPLHVAQGDSTVRILGCDFTPKADQFPNFPLYSPILTTSLIHFFLECWENVLFELGYGLLFFFRFSASYFRVHALRLRCQVTSSRGWQEWDRISVAITLAVLLPLMMRKCKYL